MKNAVVISLVSLAVLAAVGLSLGQTRSTPQPKTGLTPEARQAILTVGDDLTKLVDAHGRYVRASLEAEALTAKLLQSVREVSRLAAEADKTGAAGRDKLNQAIQDMTEMSQSFNLQYLGLQNQMQDENRRFTLLSNVMKTKHDTAKNAIGNIR